MEKLNVRIVRQNTKLRLELQNIADTELSEIQVSPIFVQGYDNVNETIMVKFDIVPTLASGESCIVPHQTYFPKAHPASNDDLWEKSDDFHDFLMCLGPKLSRGVAYELDISFGINDERDHQTTPAGAGSALEAVLP